MIRLHQAGGHDITEESGASPDTSTLRWLDPQPTQALLTAGLPTVAGPAEASALAWSAEDPEHRTDLVVREHRTDLVVGEHSDDDYDPIKPWYTRPALILATGGLIGLLALAGFVLSLPAGGGAVTVPAVKIESTAPSAASVLPPPGEVAHPPAPAPVVVVDQVPVAPPTPSTPAPPTVQTTQSAPPSSVQPPAPAATSKPTGHWPTYWKHRVLTDKSGTDDDRQNRG